MLGRNSQLFSALVLATGLVLAGVAIAAGMRSFRTADRYVSVKGIAEREVKANLALWPLRISVASNSLPEAQAKIGADAQAVQRFVQSSGLPAAAVEVQGVDATDLMTQLYRQGTPTHRYIVGQTLMLRTADVDRVSKLNERIGELVGSGVAISQPADGGPQGPYYLFTNLNSIKPAMIAEATKNARAAAEQFARDSGASIGSIRQASQGLFQILPRDAAPGQMEEKQMMKTVRVVSTVDYLLR